MIIVLKMLTSSIVTASNCEADSNCEFSTGIQMTSQLVCAYISVFTCLCPFVPCKINSSAAPQLCNNGGTGKHYMIPDAIHCVLLYTKDEMYESYSPWKGHCFAQLPSAGAAWGVESQIDKSEMTLKQIEDGCRLFVCPLDKAGAKETQSRVGWVVCALFSIAVKWLNKGRKNKGES